MIKNILRLIMVVHACNPSRRDHELEATLGYTVRTYLKNNHLFFLMEKEKHWQGNIPL